MLINFTVQNFRSFGAEQTLNMVSTSLKDHPGHCVPVPHSDRSVLQVGVLYGANASGKSNLVKAILCSQALVLGLMTPARLFMHRFRFGFLKKPVSFEYRFLVGGRTFVYGFSVKKETVHEEWLFATSDSGREVNVFSREKDVIHLGRLNPFGKDAPQLKKALIALRTLGVRTDQLLLARTMDLPNRGELLDQVAWWFKDCLTVIEADSEFPSLIGMLGTDDTFREFCGAFLKNVGTGINGIGIEQTKLDADKLPKEMLKRLQGPTSDGAKVMFGVPGFSIELDAKDPTKAIRKNLTAKHSVGEETYSLGFSDESDGTQRSLHLLPALYHMTQTCKVYVVDEIDRSLHPLLCHSLLKLFLDSCPQGCQQMIVTTHDTHLLDTELLRRDEIWFAEKDKTQQTQLASLGEWNPRKDLRIEKGYLNGRFGGIPFIGDTRKLMDMIRCPVTPGPAHKKEADGRRDAKATPA